LVNVRKLLAPGGKLWLQELAPPTKWLNFIFGSLPGWWLGEEDGRILEPYIDPEQWETRLSQAGFDGIQATHHDGQVNATMIAGLKERTNKLRVTLLVRDQGSHAEGSHAVRGVLMELESRGYDVDVRRFGQPTPAGQYVVALLDAAGPFVYGMTEQEYTELNAFIVSASGAGILWVTGLAQLQCTDPNLGMILGLCRTFRKELSVNIATLEVKNYMMAGCRAIADTLSMFMRRDANDVTNHDMEWAFVDGKIQVGRYRWISVNDRLITQPSQTGDRRLDIKQRGSLKTLQWQQCQLELQRRIDCDGHPWRRGNRTCRSGSRSCRYRVKSRASRHGYHSRRSLFCILRRSFHDNTHDKEYALRENPRTPFFRGSCFHACSLQHCPVLSDRSGTIGTEPGESDGAFFALCFC
jgi:hypothetical protein